MRIYSFGCKDGISDDGYAVVEVLDTHHISARKLATDHLTKLKREDLISSLDYRGSRPITVPSVSYSNVQSSS